MDLKIKGKRALVFGSSSGIGRAIAQSLAEEGATVALSARHEPKLASAAKSMGAKTFFVGDLSRPGDATNVVEKTIHALGGIDILVINSGGPQKGTFLEVSDTQWQEDFQNLWLSSVDAIKTALPRMKENRYGRILIVTSLAAKEPMAGLTTSSALRAGLAGLAKTIANEHASSGVTINLILPGFTDTERLKELQLSEEKIRQMVPMGRLAMPAEIGDLAAFLSSPRAAYITGQSLIVDGGALRGH